VHFPSRISVKYGMVHISFKRPLAGILLAASTTALAAGPYPNTGNFGVPFSKTEDWYRQCMRVEKLAPEAAAPEAPAGCNATDLYYIKRSQAQTSPAEWEQVRACALATNNNAVLMMLYANGYGVARDTDKAIHYACSLEFIAKAEMEGRIAHLASGEDRGKPFDQCDDTTSGAMGGMCAELRESQDRRVRDARLERSAHELPAPSRSAFARLRLAADSYAKAGAGEEDMQGTAAADLAIQHEARLREEFMQAALAAIDGKLPASSVVTFAESDRQLNQLYQSVMAAPSTEADWPDRIGGSTIAHADVRKAERAWLAYRDAFLAFRASLPSGSDPVAIKTLLTSQRIEQLRKVERYR
jgi:uncharacterized protein YecT (DUF1311 family)